MKQLFLISFMVSGGCFLFQEDCTSVGCEPGFSCQNTLFDGFECISTCGDGFFDSEIEECDASDVGGGGSACNEICELIVAENCGDGVEQPGSYCLGAEIFPPIPGNVDSFRLVDFDLDGDSDLVTISETRVEILFNSGTGFDTPPVFAFFTSAAIDQFVDLNGDGRTDITTTITLEDTRQISSFLQGANLQFIAGSTTEIPISHHFTEVNNDGNLDLVVDSEISALSILLGDGTGNFAPSQSFADDISLLSGDGITFSAPEDLFRDWDSDGDTDLLFQRGAEILLIENQNGILSETATIGTLATNAEGAVPSQKFSAQDWDNDGDFDLMVGTSRLDFTLFRNNAGAFTSQTISTNRSNLSNGAIGDFNGDGLPDVLAVFIDEGLEGPLEYSIFENDGSGQLIEVSTNQINTTLIVRARDFNGDGRSDAHFLGSTADAAILFDGTSFLDPQFVNVRFQDSYAELTGDNFLDIVSLIDNRLSIIPGGTD